MSNSKLPEIFCIDLSISNPELEAYEEIKQQNKIPVSYHCPSMNGIDSLLEHEEKRDVKALLVLGSAASVGDNLPWQNEFHPWLQGWLNREVPILGICYGHQLIAYLLGAQVGRVPSGEKYMGVRSIEVFAKNPLGLPKKEINIAVSHQDEVKDLPSGMKCFARSPFTPYEGLYHEDLPIITVQSHPEARKNFYSKRKIPFTEESFADGRDLMRRFFNSL